LISLSCSGAQGEYAGLAAIKAYLNSKGESHEIIFPHLPRKSAGVKETSGEGTQVS